MGSPTEATMNSQFANHLKRLSNFYYINSLEELSAPLDTILEESDLNFSTLPQKKTSKYSYSCGDTYNIFWHERESNQNLKMKIDFDLQYLYGEGEDWNLHKDRIRLYVNACCQDREKKYLIVPKETIQKISTVFIKQFVKPERTVLLFVNHDEIKV